MEQKPHRLNVLVIAHEMSPIQGSECAEGWNVVTRLAKYHDITVLYAGGNQSGSGNYEAEVRKYFLQHPVVEGLTLIPVRQPKITRLIAGINKYFSGIGPIGLPLLYYFGYNRWQYAAYLVAKKMHSNSTFDIIHQLTQITFREPGYCWKIGPPFIWGPTGGTATLPLQYYRILTPLSKILEAIRTFSTIYQKRWVKRIRQAALKAKLIYAFSEEDAHFFHSRTHATIKLMLDAGTYEIPQKQARNERSSLLKGIWCGQLSDRKALIILLKALADLKKANSSCIFKVIGDGPLSSSLQQKADQLGLKNIEWIRNISHDEVFSMMAQSDVLVHTSIREATSNVIPEALSMGLPVICHDINGMSTAINESCGIKVPLISPVNSIRGFRDALLEISAHPDLLEQMKIGARNRASQISWTKMVETMAHDYNQIALSVVENSHESIMNSQTPNPFQH